MLDKGEAKKAHGVSLVEEHRHPVADMNTATLSCTRPLVHSVYNKSNHMQSLAVSPQRL